MKSSSAGACVSELLPLVGKLQHTGFLSKWVQRADVTHFRYRSKKKSKISKQVARSQGESLSLRTCGWVCWIWGAKAGWGSHQQTEVKAAESPPKKKIIWIKTSAKVRMSDPDLEKNDILSTQYKLAIVTVIHVTTWRREPPSQWCGPGRPVTFPLLYTKLRSNFWDLQRVFTPVQKAQLIGLTQQGVSLKVSFSGWNSELYVSCPVWASILVNHLLGKSKLLCEIALCSFDTGVKSVLDKTICDL